MARANALIASPPWELAAESIAVKIRWFGLVIGYVVANLDQVPESNRPFLNAILALGAVYALIDTYFSFRGRVFLGRYPLAISLMEALFIGLLCFFHGGLDSPFRYYYLLSLLCCAVRHSSTVTYATCAAHCASYTLLYLALPPSEQRPLALLLTVAILGWVTWASDALALLLKRVSDYLGRLNAALRQHQAELEARIAERTRELQEAQAHVLHQEKMAALGLLAAGVVHEVGNPLTAVSSLVQMLQRRDCDAYTRDKLALVSGQLQRIQSTLRELIHFSRPASTTPAPVDLREIVDEALSIAKYYRRSVVRRTSSTAERNDTPPPGARLIEVQAPTSLPLLQGTRDQLLQVVLNLVLNALDATDRHGRILISLSAVDDWVELSVRDNGVGIPPAIQQRLFQPYFTTKRNGTGLGLFVTQKLVTAHGGSVAFESQPGEGTVFRVRFPVAGSRAAAGDRERVAEGAAW